MICLLLTVAALCYKTSANARRVVLDGFLTYNSSTSACSCSLTTTQSTNVSFISLNSIQPDYQGCESSIKIQNGGTIFTINCYVSGTITVSSTERVTLDFERPKFGYNSNYCMLVTPGIH